MAVALSYYIIPSHGLCCPPRNSLNLPTVGAHCSPEFSIGFNLHGVNASKLLCTPSACYPLGAGPTPLGHSMRAGAVHCVRHSIQMPIFPYQLDRLLLSAETGPPISLISLIFRGDPRFHLILISETQIVRS